MLVLIMAASLVVLLASNIWLLREVDALRARVKACREELTLLDYQLCRLMAEIEIREPPGTGPKGSDGVRERARECERTPPGIGP